MREREEESLGNTHHKTSFGNELIRESDIIITSLFVLFLSNILSHLVTTLVGILAPKENHRLRKLFFLLLLTLLTALLFELYKILIKRRLKTQNKPAVEKKKKKKEKKKKRKCNSLSSTSP